MDDSISSAIRWFKLRGCEVLNPKHKNTNGPDITIIKNNEAFRVEVKQIRKLKNGTWQTGPISENRKTDDFILIMHKSDVLMFQSMSDHLKLGGNFGTRSLSFEMKILK